MVYENTPNNDRQATYNIEILPQLSLEIERDL